MQSLLLWTTKISCLFLAVSARVNILAKKPKLEHVQVVMFKRGSDKIFWNTKHFQEHFHEAQFLHKKCIKSFQDGFKCSEQPCGVKTAKKEEIVSTPALFLKPSCCQLWKNFPINDDFFQSTMIPLIYVDLCWWFMLRENFISAAWRIIFSNSSKTYTMHSIPCIFLFWIGSFLDLFAWTKGYVNSRSLYFFHYFTISWKLQLT